jgi:hypothetical protein
VAGLVSDSFHLTFGCGVLAFSLYAMMVAEQSPTDTYTYGYKRLEVLAAFTNADNSMLSVCVSSCFCFSSPSLLLWRPCMPLLKMNLSTSIALTLAWPAFICNFGSC